MFSGQLKCCTTDLPKLQLLKADVQTICNATLVCVMHRQMSNVTAWVIGESIQSVHYDNSHLAQ